MPFPTDPRVLVDFRTADDAGVYLVADDLALVQTVDFFTPIVDDPYAFGQIAAANAVSDVYAMGGVPLTALAIAAFPAKDFDMTVAEAIFRGGHDKLAEAGVALLGGHTVQDSEVKFGYAVTGRIRPGRVLTNSGAKPGDQLLLTKPIGTGVISTAIKHDRAPADAVRAAIAAMSGLNRSAAGVFAEAGPEVVHACTDITGFGLLGHACEMAGPSHVTLVVRVSDVPLLPGALELSARNRPGGAATNQEYFGPRIQEPAGLDDRLRALLYDPQTSGGLFAAIDPSAAAPVVARLHAAGVEARRIGTVGPAGRSLVELI